MLLQKPLRRLTAFLLAVVLLFVILPPAFGAEVVEETDATEAAETTPPETGTTTVPMEPTESSAPTVPPESTVPTETSEATIPAETFPEETAPETTSATEPMEDPDTEDRVLPVSTIGNVLLFDQASPNYTTYLNKQLTVKYRPNGTDSSKTAYIKNLGWRFARINGVSYPDDPIYCIEPHKNFAASTSGNFVDTDISTEGGGSSHGADVWYAMPSSYREAIALTLLYSEERWDDSYSVTNTPMSENPNVPLRVATQFLIYEIVMGLRDADSFALNDTNGYTDGDIFYQAGISQISGFEDHYDGIVSAVQSAKEIPSFTSLSRSKAPTIDLKGVETVVRDTNGVLSRFRFPDGSGAKFSKSGNSLSITQVGDISPNTVFACSRELPSAGASTFSVYYGGSSTYQVCVKLHTPESGDLNAYFKLKAPASGDLALVKTTEDGGSLAGWRFGIYQDRACTRLVSGPHTTDSGGKLSVADLTPGTYYVKELGHTDGAIGGRYQCEGDNPKQVAIVNGQIASVKFHNRLKAGTIQLRKTTNTGKSLGGWKIGIYTDKACTASIPGSPFTTKEDGTVEVPGLMPGTYYAREEVVLDGYWECDPVVKTVTVVSGGTATVSFHNLHYGEVEILKTMTDGSSPAGWQFRIRDEQGKEIPGSPFQSGEDGKILTGKLLPGIYSVEEILPENSLYACTTENPQVVRVQPGGKATVTFTNALRPGKIFLEKVNDQGETLAGAAFLLEWSENGRDWLPVVYSDSQEVAKGLCNNPDLKDGCLTVGEDGLLQWANLHPGTYYRITEVRAPNGYQLLTKPAYEGKLPADGLLVELRVVNSPSFTLPKTGGDGLRCLRMLSLLCGAACGTLMLFEKKYRKEE